MNIIKRQLAKKTSHVEQTIASVEGNKVFIKIWSRVLTKTDTYVLGEAIDEEILEGEKVKVRLNSQIIASFLVGNKVQLLPWLRRGRAWP